MGEDKVELGEARTRVVQRSRGGRIFYPENVTDLVQGEVMILSSSGFVTEPFPGVKIPTCWYKTEK